MDGGSRLVSVIEAVWAEIRAWHPDVPEAFVTVGPGSGCGRRVPALGWFAPDRWAGAGTTVGELFVAGEGVRLGSGELLNTLLHEACHGIAGSRGLADTSRQGRYHNRLFRGIALEVGLEPVRSPRWGWSDTVLPAATAARFQGAVDALEQVAGTHRVSEPAGRRGRASSDNGNSLVCACGRRVRCSSAVRDGGPILCGVCGSPFVP
ncbi:MAG: hypothetical protein LBH76_09455 [Propionibacteriaceae bacterium]|jgi:hypothetical protein|nr:hypothetical protein [Propionibacteriaceae bacterium]